MNIYIPDDYKRVLREQYGNWEEPNPLFNYLYDSPGYLKAEFVEPKSNNAFPELIK